MRNASACLASSSLSAATACCACCRSRPAEFRSWLSCTAAREQAAATSMIAGGCAAGDPAAGHRSSQGPAGDPRPGPAGRYPDFIKFRDPAPNTHGAPSCPHHLPQSLGPAGEGRGPGPGSASAEQGDRVRLPAVPHPGTFAPVAGPRALNRSAHRAAAESMFHRKATTPASRNGHLRLLPRGGPADPAVSARACCCPARPLVKVMMPTTRSRRHPVGLWLCGPHCRASREALAARRTCAGRLHRTMSLWAR